MNVTSKPINVKITSLKPYVKHGFTGACGSADKTGGWSLVCDPKVMEEKLTQDTLVPSVLTVVQWDSEIPLSVGKLFTIKTLEAPESITPAEALAALEELMKRERK